YGAFGELDLTHVVLREDDLLARAGLAGPEDDHLSLLASHDHPLAQFRRQRLARLDSDQPRPVDHARVEQPGEVPDEPRAPDPEGRGLPDPVHPDLLAPADPVGGAQGAALPMPDVRAL